MIESQRLQVLKKQRQVLIILLRENEPSLYRYTWAYEKASRQYHALEAAIRHLDVMIRNLTSWEKKMG